MSVQSLSLGRNFYIPPLKGAMSVHFPKIKHIPLLAQAGFDMSQIQKLFASCAEKRETFGTEQTQCNHQHCGSHCQLQTQKQH